MKKNLKRAIIICLVSVYMLVIFGCGKTEVKNKYENTVIDITSDMPNYEDREVKEMWIGAFWCPIDTEEQYQWLKDCGFNVVFIDQYIKEKNASTGIDKDFKVRKHIVEICEKLEINYLISMTNGDTIANMVQKLDLKGRKHFLGFASDEPTAYKTKTALPWFDLIVGWLDEIDQIDPNMGMYVNLLQNTVDIDLLGTKDFSEYYDLFVSKILNRLKVKSVSSDVYPLRYNKETGETFLERSWLSVTEAHAMRAKDLEDTDFRMFMQSLSMAHENRLPTEKDIRYQAYTYFAYGVNGLDYFTYRMPGDGVDVKTWYADNTALLDYDNNRTQVYYDVKIVNEEIQKMQKVYSAFEYQGTMSFYGSETLDEYNANFESVKSSLASYPGINKLHSTQDMLVGCFKDKDENDGFIVVNFPDPAWNRENVVRINFNNAEKALVYRGGKSYAVMLDSGVFKTVLEPGEGLFVIPLAK